MLNALRWLIAGTAAVLASAGLGVWALAAQPPAPPPGVHVQAPGVDVQVGVAGPMKVSEYWLGLECHPAPPALRAQLGLPEDQGLLVEQVVPDAPAAKAGIQQHDVLVKAGQTVLADIPDLVGAVDAAKQTPLTLELIRGGQRITIQVTPAKRPEGTWPGPWAPQPEQEAMRRWFDWFQQGGQGRPPFLFRFFHPGAILPPGTEGTAPLPKDMSIAITKSGTAPAKIVVQRGNERWEVTENELEKLPADIRPHVEQMLGRGLKAVPVPELQMDFGPEMPGGQQPEGPALRTPGPPRVLEKRLEKMIEEMSDRIERLEKMLQERARLKPPEKKPTQPQTSEPEKASLNYSVQF